MFRCVTLDLLIGTVVLIPSWWWRSCERSVRLLYANDMPTLSPPNVNRSLRSLVEPCFVRVCVMVVVSGIKISYANCESLRLIEPKTPKTSLVLFVFGALQTSPALTHADPAEPSLEISPWVEFLSWFHAKDDLPFSFSFTIFLFLFSFRIFCACVAVSLWVSGKIFALWSQVQIGFFSIQANWDLKILRVGKVKRVLQ